MPADLGFDFIVILLGIWLAVGAYFDSWMHISTEHLDTFFTPGHTALYAGFTATAVFFIASLIANIIKGFSWKNALPPGYELSMVGVTAFGLSGVGDLIWHTLFGIEHGIEALISPTHLVLVIGGALVVTGPLRAALLKSRLPRGFEWLPPLASLTLLLSAVTLITQYVHPFAGVRVAGSPPTSIYYLQAIGVAGVILQSGFLAGVVLFAIKSFGYNLPFGSLTLIISLNSAALLFINRQQWMIPSTVLAGIFSDILLHKLKPSLANPKALRIFAFSMPAILYFVYFTQIFIVEGIWWSVHLWTGSVVLAGLVGLLLSFLIV